MESSVAVRREDGRAVVAIAGDMDVYSAPDIRREFVETLATGPVDLIVDLTELDFIDSSGLGVLIAARKRVMAQGGSLRLVCQHERHLKLFRITGLNRVFLIHPTMAEATAAGKPSDLKDSADPPQG